MKFQLDKAYGLHIGGTKFYQVFRVLIDESMPGVPGTRRMATVTHWGKQIGPAGQRRPVEGGQTKIASGDTYSEAIRAKRGRDYNFEIRWGTTDNFSDMDALRTRLVEEFGEVETVSIMASLGVEPGAKFDPSETPDTSPSVAAARAAHAPEIPASSEITDMEGWGAF